MSKKRKKKAWKHWSSHMHKEGSWRECLSSFEKSGGGCEKY